MDAAHAGKTYSFDGGKVLNCSNKGKVYTCPTLVLPEWDDKMLIGDGYTVNVEANVAFGWNHGLRMSGTARLTSTGSINLAGLAPGSLVVTGGSFDAGGDFRVAGPTPFKADVIAGTLTLGTGTEIQITGTMQSRGAVSVSSYATIIGPVSGTSITTNSPFKITGEVKASNTLLIASGAVIEGPVSATTSITINSPATLSSTVTSQGPVSIGSHANIGGAVKGSVITANSPVTLKGDVTATSRFTLGSGSTVTGNIVAPEVELYASQSKITGNITASKLLTMGDSVKVTGAVDTGTLTMYASNAMIEGIAKVNFATLYWNGRVTDRIVCKGGTRPGYCDCVDNQSGNPVNSANGPRCEGASPPPTGLRHFLITHDGSAGTCAVEYVKVSACANADCSTLYNGGATVTMTPGGSTVDIDSSGVNARAAVSSIATGNINLTLTQGGTKPTVQCFNGKSNTCAMEFTGGANFSIDVADHGAGNTITAAIKALKANDSQSACIPAFTDEKSIRYSCEYNRPNSGSAKMTVTTNVGATGSFACNASSQLKTRFDNAGSATIDLTYPDAGEVALNASFDDTVTGTAQFVVAPDHFDLKVGTPLRAGADFKVDIEARNKSGEVTPNFDPANLPIKATQTAISLDCLGANMVGSLPTTDTEFSKGKASATLNFSEAGYLDLRAKLTGFLGSKLETVGSTGGVTSGKCQAKVGPFVPAFFQVELNDVNRKKTNFYYSGEPIPLKLSARNAKGEITKNYPIGYGSDDVISFSAVKPKGDALDPGTGAVSGTFEAKHFVAGEAPQATAPPGATIATPTFTFVTALTAPTQIRLRADNQHTDDKRRITSVYAGAEPEQARPYIRTGRLRLGKRFGRVGTQPVKMPLTVEYWSSNSWVLNTQDSFSVIPGSAFAQVPGSASTDKPAANTLPTVTIMNGTGELPVSGNVAGWIDIAVNLGPNLQDASCMPTHPASTGAKLAWLRSPLDCKGQAGTPADPTDPSARATFGIFPIENRRIIHVREVFN